MRNRELCREPSARGSETGHRFSYAAWSELQCKAMRTERGPYNAEFPVGTRVRIAERAFLEEFRKTWRYHHPLQPDQLPCAGVVAEVEKIGYYHGGDELYWLKGVPGVWHERCLKAAIHEIIPLESHSAGIRLRGAWESVPRWLRVVLLLTFVVVVALISILVKR